ncbi:MAG TPA: hypothetical protein VF773_18825 [Verrucomicrobiae bacterium]
MPLEEKVTVALPENLERQFTDLRKRLFRLETLFALASAVSAILLSFFFVIVSDRLWDTPIWLRVILFGAGFLAAAAALMWWLRKWVIQPPDLKALAILVQRKYRRLGDRLLGIVELTNEKTRPAYFSPELYRAAIAQVNDEASKYNFSDAANSRASRRQMLTSAGLVLIVLLPAIILPDATWNSFQRWIVPFAQISRFTLVEVAGLPRERIVAHGEKFTVSGKLAYRSFWKPARMRLELANGQRIEARAREGAFEAEVPAQVQDITATVRAGDATEEIRFLAKHRPAVEVAGAQIQLPKYLGYPEQSETAQGGLLEVLEGSSISLTGRVSRALQSASMQVADRAEAVTVESNIFSTAKFVAQDATEVSLVWQDTIGLSNAAPWKLSVQTRKDSAPVPEIEELYRDTAMLETEVLPIPIRASDDFGVKSIGLNWNSEAQGDEESTNKVDQPRRETVQNIAGMDTKYIEQTINFSPAVLGIQPESTIEIRAFAVDYLPGRERSESPIYRIHVMGNAQHAEMVRQNLESLLVQLEEVTRLEEKIASDTRELKDLQKLDTPEAAKKIAELEQAQQQNAAQLQQLAQEGMKTLREALRNPAFNEQTLAEWTKNLAQMQKVSQQQMKDAAKSLQQAAQSQSPSEREEKLAEAQKKEEETIEALQQMQQKVNEGLDELQALTLAQRLRQMGEREKKLETTLQTNIPDTIGLTPAELNARYKRANEQLSGMQTETQAESVKIQGEISRFYERTQKPAYGEVTKEMTDAKPGDELDRVRGLIQENIGMEAMHNLALWSERFESWATKLEPKSEDSGSGSGSGEGGGEQDNAALKQLLGLLRMREKQVNIQERTRLLHERVEEKLTYRDGSVLLAASQGKLNRDMSKQAGENTFPMLEEAYNDTVVSMSDVESLLDRPRTDDVTRSAQDKSIAMMTDLVNLLNEQAKRSSSSSGKGQGEGSEEMAFLMQMMTPQPAQGSPRGQTPGANMAGGTTDRASEPGENQDSGGKPGEERAVRKSSGVPQNYPTEFREALENYYRALEQTEKK